MDGTELKDLNCFSITYSFLTIFFLIIKIMSYLIRSSLIYVLLPVTNQLFCHLTCYVYHTWLLLGSNVLKAYAFILRVCRLSFNKQEYEERLSCICSTWTLLCPWNTLIRNILDFRVCIQFQYFFSVFS